MGGDVPAASYVGEEDLKDDVKLVDDAFLAALRRCLAASHDAPSYVGVVRQRT